MKVSFLIPSKNRLHLLKQAVSSVLSLGDSNIEIVISDNASEQDYRSYLDSIGNPRIKYMRSDHPLSVTENWEKALSAATGDYILMLGDDDALSPFFFDNVRPVLAADGPDIIFLAAYHYCYPNVMPGQPNGYLAICRNSEFLTGQEAPFSISPDEAKRLANTILDMRQCYAFNAQHFMLKASFVREMLRGGNFYRSPYPDIYAAMVTFWRARSIKVIPKESLLIGISPSSFGFYFFNQLIEEGFKFLDNQAMDLDAIRSLDEAILPGDRNNTYWLVAAEIARRTVADPATQLLNVKRYRSLQMLGLLRSKYVDGKDIQSVLAELQVRLSESEKYLFNMIDESMAAALRTDRNTLVQMVDAMTRSLGQFSPAHVEFLDIGPHQSITDAVSWLSRKRATPRGAATGDACGR